MSPAIWLYLSQSNTKVHILNVSNTKLIIILYFDVDRMIVKTLATIYETSIT